MNYKFFIFLFLSLFVVSTVSAGEITLHEMKINQTEIAYFGEEVELDVFALNQTGQLTPIDSLIVLNNKSDLNYTLTKRAKPGTYKIQIDLENEERDFITIKLKATQGSKILEENYNLQLFRMDSKDKISNTLLDKKDKFVNLLKTYAPHILIFLIIWAVVLVLTPTNKKQ